MLQNARADVHDAQHAAASSPSSLEGSARAANYARMDYGLINSLSRFNREKIPERAVHARGAGAYGEFEVTDDVSDICDIDALVGVGKKTPCVVRFSTTALGRGSAESVRDVKGMAVKLMTRDGPWDWVCLNIPMFFIRDPRKFPALVHAQRPDPRTNLANPARWWEFVCANHEALHMVMFQFSDFGTMFDYRSMSGYVGHAYKWVRRDDGRWKYVHWFLASDQGPNFEKGSQKTSSDGTAFDAESATRDLNDALERGDFPSWTVKVQVIDPSDAPDLAFNILDVSKHWNMGNYPLDIPVIPARTVGKLTLTRGPQDYDAEIERLAFSPSHLVPGVEPSEDPMLQARLFSYPDAHRHRLGASYIEPEAAAAKQSTTTPALKPQGERHAAWVAQTTSTAWSEPQDDDYKFPREFWKVLPRLRSVEFQESLVVNMAESVAQTPRSLRRRIYDTLRLVADDLAQRVEDAAEALADKNGMDQGRESASG